MIYTCYDMIRDCRGNRPEGWAHFVEHYVALIRKMLEHYAPGQEGVLERVLTTVRKPDAELFRTMEPSPERWFIAELRQTVVGELPGREAEISLDLETLTEALEPLTMVEREAAWLETMGYNPVESAAMLRMAPPTVQKIRTRASELIRGKVDQWNSRLMVDNGTTLGRAAAAARTPDCLAPKVFLDVLDGRTPWHGRYEMEQHATKCWHCIDHFCRLVEVVELLRGVHPLTAAEAAPYRQLMGIPAAKQSGWKRWLGAG